ncbi:MAG: hypothetical protein V3V22_09920 [Methylococcales bacterium]
MTIYFRGSSELMAARTLTKLNLDQCADSPITDHQSIPDDIDTMELSIVQCCTSALTRLKHHGA